MFAKVVVYFMVAFATRNWLVWVVFAGGLQPTSKNHAAFVFRSASGRPKQLLYFGRLTPPKLAFVYRVAEGHSIQLSYFGRRQPPKILAMLI